MCRICSAQRVNINSYRAQTMCNTVVHTEQRGGVAEVQRRSGTALSQHLARRVHYVREPEKVRSEGSVGEKLTRHSATRQIRCVNTSCEPSCGIQQSAIQ
jgi:hypothetical protein